MSNSINTLLRNKANNKIYYPITKGENIIQDKDHRLVTDEQTTSWDKLKETKYDKTGGTISGDVSISTGNLYLDNAGINTIYGMKSDKSNLLLIQSKSDSTGDIINLGDSSSKLYLSANTTPLFKDSKMNKDFVFLTEDNIRNTKIQRVMLSYGGDIVVGDNPTSLYNLISGDNQKNITIGCAKCKINMSSDIYFKSNTGIKSSSGDDLLMEKDKYIYLGNSSKPLHLLNDIVMEKSKLYMTDGDSSYMALSLINSTVELGNSSINTSILGSGDLKYNGYKVLNTNNYATVLNDIYLSKTAQIPANRVYSGAANPFNGALYMNKAAGIRSANLNDILLEEKDDYIQLGNDSKSIKIVNNISMNDDSSIIVNNKTLINAKKNNNNGLSINLGSTSLDVLDVKASTIYSNGATVLNTVNYAKTLDNAYLSKTAQIPANRVYSGAANPFNGALYISKAAGIRSANLNDILLEEKDNYIQLGNSSKPLHLLNDVVMKKSKLYMADGDSTYMALSIINSTVELGNSSINTSILGSGDLKYNGYKVLNTNNYATTLDNAYLSKTAQIPANRVYSGAANPFNGALYLRKAAGIRSANLNDILLEEKDNYIQLGNSQKEINVSSTLKIDSNSYIALDEDAYISSSSNDGAGTILQYKSGVLHVGASSKELQLDCTLARINSGMILTQYNYKYYIGDTYIKSSGGTLSGTINGEGSVGPVLTALYHGSSPGEIIIGNYDSASAPSITLTGSSITARCLSVTGSKNCVQHTESYGDILFYSTEDAESLLTWTNKLQSCNTGKSKEIKVEIDPMFKESVDLENDYIVDIYKISFGDYRIKEKTKDYFILESSVDNFEFQFSIKAHRKGYETAYMDKFNKPSSIE